SKLPFADAERLKINEGFVSLGGAYEEPENPHQAAISKIARQFMTRLHIQVNQTMQFYRGQQGGSAPARLFLSGGASIMPYTAQFFAEKLNVPVEYFNPLRNVQIDPSINLEELARYAHSMGEIVGLGLRNLAQCPGELNLMPDSTLKWQSFNQKKPYLIATVFSLVAGVAGVAVLFDKLATNKSETLAETHAEVEKQKIPAQRFEAEYRALQKGTNDVARILGWMQDRYYWADVMKEVRGSLIKVEGGMKTLYRADTGIWIELYTTAAQTEEMASAMGAPPSPDGGVSAEARAALARRYGLTDRGAPPPPPPDAGAPPADGSNPGAPARPKKAKDPNSVDS